MVKWMQKLSDQLDKDQPNWYEDWATGQEGTKFIREISRPSRPGSSVRPAIDDLKNAVARRLFHRILNSALGAGIITEVNE